MGCPFAGEDFGIAGVDPMSMFWSSASFSIRWRHVSRHSGLNVQTNFITELIVRALVWSRNETTVGGLVSLRA